MVSRRRGAKSRRSTHGGSKSCATKETEINLTTSKNALWGWLGLLALCGLTFFLGLGGLPLTGPDEPRYAEIGREMFASGDWITPRMNGYLWLEKPIWLYWGQAISYYLFGVNEFAARFPSALSALVTVLFVAFAVGKMVSRRWGFLAGAVLATSAFWLAFARGASTDMGLASAIAVAVLAAYLAFHSQGRARAGYWLLFAFALGVSMLAKGLIGILLICAIVGIHRLGMKQPIVPSMRRNSALLWLGSGVFALTVASWYVPVTLVNGMTFIDEFFVNHHFKRFFENEFHHLQPFYFYFVVVGAELLPWPFFLAGAIARLKRLGARDDARGELLLLAWIWALVPILFFSVSKSKLPSYILPSLPPLAIIIGWELERICRGEVDIWGKIGLGFTSLIAAIAGIGFAVYVFRDGVSIAGWGFLGLVLPPLLGVAALVAFIFKKREWTIAATASLTASMALAAVVLLFGHLGPKMSKAELATAAFQNLKPGESIVYYRKVKEYAPIFYARGRVLFYRQVNDANGKPIPGKSTLLPPGSLSTGDEIDALTPDELMLAIHQSPTRAVVVITEEAGAVELASQPRFHTQLIRQQGKVMALRVELVQ